MKISSLNSHTLLQYFSPREGETKIGDVVSCLSLDDLRQSEVKYVIIGVPEDIGVRANGGIGGADTLWASFLSAFLNMQSTFFDGQKIGLLGTLNVETNTEIESTKEELYHQVETLDNQLSEILLAIHQAGKLPIIIGGGHNNAYPNIKSLSLAQNKKINCINIDAHHDYRKKEGRHSGNGFRYAMDEGYLLNYFMIGLQKYYMQENILREMTEHPQIHMIFYDDMLDQSEETIKNFIIEKLKTITPSPLALEIDMDVMAGVLSSAMTPTGLSVTEIRKIIRWIINTIKPSYLHLCEGIIMRNDGAYSHTNGKLAATLVADYIYNFQKI